MIWVAIAAVLILCAFLWLVLDTRKAASELQLRTSHGRRLPPRSPSHRKRGF